jgi:benzoyl-CoA reductase/2-hydroxyglutaryl-CoA dehydratase subunit BcrC/BadD/HgdB
MIEVEQNLPVSEQMRTRMEAFVEILEARRS